MATKHSLTQIDDIGDDTATAIHHWLCTVYNQCVLDSLVTNGVQVEVIQVATTPVGEQPLLGQAWCVTGTLHTGNRDQAKAKLESLGAKIVGSVSKKTDALLAGEKAGSKLEKALSLGVKVYNEAEFNELVGN